MEKGWGREFQKCILKYMEKPFRQKFQPDNAAMNMRLRDDGMGDPSVAESEWMTGRKNPRLVQARACQTCAQVSMMAFTDFWAERWDLLDLGKECEHDWVYGEVPQTGPLAQGLKQASAEAEEYFTELESRTDLGKVKMRQEMEEDHGGAWWDYKLRPICLSCKALPDGTTLETRKEHAARRTSKEVARANAWEHIRGHNRLDWQLTNIEHYREFTGDDSVAPNDENAETKPTADVHASRPDRGARHICGDRGPDGGQVQRH